MMEIKAFYIIFAAILVIFFNIYMLAILVEAILSIPDFIKLVWKLMRD